jgi:hypothetical protein
MNGFRLLALDIDGTLVNSRDELSPATRAAVLRAAQAGIRVVLATGRRYSRVLPLVEPLGIDVPLVTASGALVKDPLDHCTFFRAEFDHATLVAMLKLVDASGFDPLLCGDTFLRGFDYYQAAAAARTPELAEYLEMNPDCGRILPGLLADPPAEAFMSFAMGTQSQMLALETRLQQELPGRLVTHVLRSPRYRGFLCEIAPAGVDKWSGIRHLATHWGIPNEAICAVGDDVNDIPMIRGARLGVAMGNALPPVKAVADLVVSSHDEDGLVQVIERILSP